MTFFQKMQCAIAAATFTLASAVSAEVVSSPALLFFGNVVVDTESAPLTLTVQNTGAAPVFLAANEFLMPLFFKVTGGTCNVTGQTLAAGGQCTLTLVHRSTELNYRGESFRNTLLAVSSFPAEELPPTLTVSPIDFGKVGGITPSATATIVLPVSARSVQIAHDANALVSLNYPQCIAVESSPNSCTVDISFPWRAIPATFSDSIVLLLANKQLVKVLVTGTYETNATPAFSITPSPLSFGNTLLGTSKTLSLTVKNNGTSNATISSLGTNVSLHRIAGEISKLVQISNDSCSGVSLLPGATCTVGLIYSARALFEVSANLFLLSPAGTTSISLSGFGVASLSPLSASPASVNFGRWDPSLSKLLRTSKIGIVNSTPSAVEFLPYNSYFKNSKTDFRFVGLDCGDPTSSKIPAQARCVATFLHASGSAFDLSNTFYLKSALGLLEIPVSIDFGATPSPLVVSSIDMDSLEVNKQANSPLLTISNPGPTAATVYGVSFGEKFEPVNFFPFKKIALGSVGTCMLSAEPFTLSPNESCTFSIIVETDKRSDLVGNSVFVSSDVGALTGTITGNSTISGSKLLTVSPSKFNFGAGTLADYFDSAQSIVLSNSNSFDVVVSRLASEKDALFRLSEGYNQSCGGSRFVGWVIPANGSCALQIVARGSAPFLSASTVAYLDADVGAAQIELALTTIPERTFFQKDKRLNEGIEFSSEVAGELAVASITLENRGLSTIEVTGANRLTAFGISVIAGGTCGSAIPFQIAPGKNCTLRFGRIAVAAANEYSYGGSFELFSTGGPLTFDYRGYIVAAPIALSADTVAVDFGRLILGEIPPLRKIRITNPANTAVQIYSFGLSFDFSRSSLSETNSCGFTGAFGPGSCDIAISVASFVSQPGELNGSLRFHTSGGSLLIPLRAVVVGRPTLSTPDVVLASNRDGESLPAEFILTNTDSAPMLLRSVTFSNAQFRLVGGTCGYAGSFVLLGSSSCSVRVVFRPGQSASIGFRSTVISITSSNGSVQSWLSGNVTSAIAYDAPSIYDVPPETWIESEPVSLSRLSANGLGAVSGGEVSVGCTGVYSATDFVARNDTKLCMRVKSVPTLGSTATVRFSITIAGLSSPDLSGSFSVTTGQSLLPHYYQSILGRTPDVAGKAGWSVELWRMVQSRADQIEGYRVVAFGFFNSAEYKNRNRGDRDYIGDLYLTFFNRTPGAAEVDAWMTYLPTLGRDGLMHHFLHSAEFDIFMRDRLGINGAARAETFAVTDFYRGFFRRLPDPTGLSGWVQQYRTAQCEPDSTKAASVKATARNISYGFLGSAEYAARATTNAQFVNDLYSAFLRRGADLGGFNGWKSQLDAGSITRSQLMDGFIGSAEFNSRVGQVAAAPCGG